MAPTERHRPYNVTYTVTFKSSKGSFDFARLLAKIAYGFAVANFGSGIIRDAYVLPSILGQTDDVGKWVGCAGESSDTTSYLHDIKIGVKNDQIYVWIRLFAMLRGVTPEYLVVVGQAPAHKSSSSNHALCNGQNSCNLDGVQHLATLCATAFCGSMAVWRNGQQKWTMQLG